MSNESTDSAKNVIPLRTLQSYEIGAACGFATVEPFFADAPKVSVAPVEVVVTVKNVNGLTLSDLTKQRYETAIRKQFPAATVTWADKSARDSA